MSNEDRPAESDGLSGHDRRAAIRARLSVSLGFLIMGSIIGNWGARVPEVRHRLALDEAAWGLATTAITVGQLLSLSLVTVLVGRVDTRRLTLAGAWLLLLNAPLMTGAPTVPALVAGLLMWGFAANLLATPVNALAVDVERRYARPLMASFHACFSVGTLGGGLVGAFAAAAGVSPQAQMAVNSLVLGALLAWVWRWLPNDAEAMAADGSRRPLRARFTRQLGLVASLVFLATVAESAAGQWSAIYAADAVGAGAVAGAATFTGLTLAITIVRFAGDRVAGRFGRIRFLRWSGMVAAVGLALALVLHTFPAALVGFVILGLGLGCAVPTLFAHAGRQPGLGSGEGVSVAVLGQWPAYFVGPPLIGLLAGLFSLRLALVTLIVAVLLLVLFAGRIAPVAEPAPVARP